MSRSMVESAPPFPPSLPASTNSPVHFRAPVTAPGAACNPGVVVVVVVVAVAASAVVPRLRQQRGSRIA